VIIRGCHEILLPFTGNIAVGCVFDIGVLVLVDRPEGRQVRVNLQYRDVIGVLDNLQNTEVISVLVNRQYKEIISVWVNRQ